MIRTAALLCAVALAACSAEPEPPANAVTIEVPRPAPEPVAAVPNAPLAPGELPSPELEGAVAAAGRWERVGDTARFGSPGRAATFAIRCHRAERKVAFLLPGGDGATMRIIAASGAATYPSTRSGSVLEAEATAEDRFVADTLRRAAGQIAVQAGDAAPIAMPADPAIAQAIEACRGPR